jgi:hypothetical protein
MLLLVGVGDVCKLRDSLFFEQGKKYFNLHHRQQAPRAPRRWGQSRDFMGYIFIGQQVQWAVPSFDGYLADI